MATAGLEVPDAAPEAEEEALEVVATLGPGESPARRAAGMADMARPRTTATDATVNTRGEEPTELVPSAPRRTWARTPRMLLAASRKWSHLWWAYHSRLSFLTAQRYTMITPTRVIEYCQRSNIHDGRRRPATEAKHISTVKRLYVTLLLKDVNRLPTVPFPPR